jgi:hypothetical protein
MYRLQSFSALILTAVTLGLAGCGNTTTETTAAPVSGNATVNFVVTDTPPTNVTVLSFQVQLASSVLQPGNVSLLPRPVTVDLAQLATDTGFLASTIIGSGTYTSLTVTLANPQVTLMNNTAATLSLNGQSCAAGATCTYIPVLNNASVTVSSGVFPVTVAASSSTGINLDLSIPDLLQSDLSVTLANGKSANFSLLPQPSSTSAFQAEIDDILGTVTAVSGTQVSITTSFGDTLVLTSSSATKYKYPTSVCATSSASCLAVGQVITADLGMLGSGGLALNTLSYAGGSGAQVAKGLLLSKNTSGAVPTVQILLRRAINLSGITPGQIVTVALPTTAPYAVGLVSYPGVSGGTFTSALDLLPGQEVVIDAGSAVVTGSSPSFTASAIYLEASQTVGQVATINTASTSLAIAGLSGLFTASHPIVQQINVQTDATTDYPNTTLTTFSSITKGQFIAAKGPLFNTTGTAGYPTLSAAQLVGRATGN